MHQTAVVVDDMLVLQIPGFLSHAVWLLQRYDRMGHYLKLGPDKKKLVAR